MSTAIPSLALILAASIAQYKRVYGFLVNMDREVGTASDSQLHRMIETLGELQHAAEDIDKSVLPLLDKESMKNNTLRPLLDERQTVVKEIVRLNSVIQEKAIGVKSLLAHELGALRRGQTAHCGYKSQSSSLGRIVDSTS